MRKTLLFIVLLLAVLFPTIIFAQTAKVVDLKGQVLVKTRASSDWAKAKINMVLSREAELETKKGSRCTLAFDEEMKNIITLNENSHIKIERY